MMMCMCPGMSIIVAMKAERGLIFKYVYGKRTDRVPRILGENYNSDLIERLYEAGGNVMLDLIIYLSSHSPERPVSVPLGSLWRIFCHKMGYNRTNLQRKLTEEQLTAMFGSRTPPKYVVAGTAGKSVTHPIETVFEAAIYKLGLENLYYPVAGEDGRTSYNFVQILKRFVYCFPTSRQRNRRKGCIRR